jgi:hypothetical protein
MSTFRRAVTAVVAAGAATMAVSSMHVGAHAAGQPTLVGVSVTNENGVVRVGTGVPGQPLLGASIDTNTGRVCIGFSYQVPQCVTLGIGVASSAAPTPVYADADASDGRVGVGVLLGPGSPVAGISYDTTTGQACAGIGLQRPTCTPLQ